MFPVQKRLGGVAERYGFWRGEQIAQGRHPARLPRNVLGKLHHLQMKQLWTQNVIKSGIATLGRSPRVLISAHDLTRHCTVADGDRGRRRLLIDAIASRARRRYMLGAQLGLRPFLPVPFVRDAGRLGSCPGQTSEISSANRVIFLPAATCKTCAAIAKCGEAPAHGLHSPPLSGRNIRKHDPRDSG